MTKCKVNFVVSFVLFFSVAFSLSFATIAKADTNVNSQQGVAVRSASISTKSVIKVPDRTAERKEAEKKKAAATTARLSRGSSGFSGGNTVASGSTSNVVSYAYKFLGTPYVWGASGPRAFDCSGFTAYVYKAFGVSLDHYTGSQAQVGQAVSKSNLIPGDLVFFNTYGALSHVGIYIGGGQFIHASSGSGVVTVSELSGSYYESRYAGARRMLN